MTEDIMQSYARDGYVSAVPVMTEAEAAELVAKFEQVEERLGPSIFKLLNVKGHLLFPFLWDVVQDARIVARVAEILGPDVLCWGSSFFCKQAGSADVVPWHQDGTCWGLNAPRGLTAWLALTPSTPETGCLRVIPESHTAAVPHAVRNAASSMLPLGEEVREPVDETRAVDCVLRPGEMSIHHVMLVHGSATNRATTGRRIGFAIRYIAGDVAQRGTAKGYATMVRGQDHGTYLLEAKPKIDLEPEALRRHRDILRHSAGIVMREAATLDADPR
ncbi:phytanoyl-CoA dioxygenase family protein [Roseovarius mucosus]|uniref:phytanoyl-CoA dioxygenase family protein n=1 Tax=Roseovarius mucosus TaxID=215743 RepID=UPI0035D08077|tara:strand:- start:705 stop:1529 length:825 start_codon:yes stop_codon:yes gene_type:complete